MIESYPISISLKLKLKAYVEAFWGDGPGTAGQVAHAKPPFVPRADSDAKEFPKNEE
jgi:hypothetical protein